MGFIKKARKTHGDKYDYSKVEYVNNKTKIKIICPIHGEFLQTPNSHLVGCGCRKCGFKRTKLNTDEFIKKAKLIHGNYYDYSKVNYINNKEKIIIVCPIHGEFLQFPVSHLQGKRCHFCYEKKKATNEEFIEKARLIHGNYYDYSKVNYINNREKVIIICPIHGEFLQSPTKHLSGQDCRKCMGNKLRKHFQSSKDQFVEKAQKIHGNKYNYSLVKYENAHLKVEIICPKHGVFLQSAHSHLNGNGCSECFSDERQKFLQETFIEKIKKVFPNYDYSKVKYKNLKTKIEIICPEHGSFFKTPTQLFNNSKCPKCPRPQRKQRKCNGKRQKNKKQKYNNNIKPEYIEKANKVFNNKYDYTKANFKDKEIIIICKKHGEFRCLPGKHLRGFGCRQCSKEMISKNRSMSLERFIEKANKVHNNKYQYININFKNTYEKIEIICPKHGPFDKKINNHLNGQGCPRCSCIGSKKSRKWLEKIGNLEPEFPIYVNNKKYIVDGFDKISNIIYEFYGDFWHGNPKVYEENDCNKRNGTKFGELYKKTLVRALDLVNAGFKLIYKWETEHNMGIGEKYVEK